jgi:hypothetical protein
MEGQFECGKKIRWIHKKLAQAIFSSIITAILIEFMLLKLLTKIHLIHVFIFLSSFYIYSHGQEFYDHGLFNFLGYIIIVITIIILFLPLNIIVYLIRKKKKTSVFIYVSFLIFLLLFYFYFIHSKLNCRDWHRGLNNTFIENDVNKFGCQIKFPKICPYKIGTYFLDLSKIYNIKCGNDLNGKEKTLKFSDSLYINENTTRFGYPLTNKDPMCLNKPKKTSNIDLYVKKNILDMDNKKLLTNGKNNIPEIIVDFSKNKYGKLIINVNYNDTLSKERKNLAKNSKPYKENILILYFDSVSRTNGLRQLKKTFKFIEKFMPYKGYFNKLYPNEKYHAFQFLKFHSFRFHTRGNYPKMFYGCKKGSNIVRITKYLKINGYVTGFSNDFCQLDSCYLPHNMSQEEISDHEFIICDANKKDINSMIKRCLYDKINIEHQLEYGIQFWRKYKNNRKFLLIVNNDGHEGTLEVIKYDDKYVYNFLKNLFNENLLKDSIVMILSDHGCPMPSIYYFNDFFKYDDALPMLYILSYDKKNLTYDEQYKHLIQNQQKLITAYDIYNTIGHLIYWDSYKKIKDKEKSSKDTPKTKFGKSIFTKIDSKRVPSDYKNMSKKVCVIIKKKYYKK